MFSDMKTRLYADECLRFLHVVATENTAPRSLLPELKRINARLSVSINVFLIQKEIPDAENPERFECPWIYEGTSLRFDTLFHLERECCNVDVIDNIASLSRAALVYVCRNVCTASKVQRVEFSSGTRARREIQFDGRNEETTSRG